MRLAQKPTRSAARLESGDVKRKGSRCDFCRDRILGCRLVLSRLVIGRKWPFFCRDRIHKAFRVLSRKHYHQMAPLSRRDRTPAYFRILSRQEKRPNCRKHGHDRTQRFTTILSRQIIAAQQALPTAAYLTRSLRPTRRMVVVVMPLSWQSLLMVVWCCLAILERVSPFLMV